jgi:hypothetical protein
MSTLPTARASAANTTQILSNAPSNCCTHSPKVAWQHAGRGQRKLISTTAAAKYPMHCFHSHSILKSHDVASAKKKRIHDEEHASSYGRADCQWITVHAFPTETSHSTGPKSRAKSDTCVRGSQLSCTTVQDSCPDWCLGGLFGLSHCKAKPGAHRE